MRFILIDEILELVPGQRIKARKYVSPDEEFFADHFPGFPVVPGVLLTEMMAQASGKLLKAEDSVRGNPMLTRIIEASFRDWMRPGETATIYGEIKKSRSSFATTICHLEVESRKVCTAELMFSFLSHDKFAATLRDEVLDRFLADSLGNAAGSPDV